MGKKYIEEIKRDIKLEEKESERIICNITVKKKRKKEERAQI